MQTARYRASQCASTSKGSPPIKAGAKALTISAVAEGHAKNVPSPSPDRPESVVIRT
jgi:hypothetical protein